MVYGVETRQQVVHRRLYAEPRWTADEVQYSLGICATQQREVLRRYQTTGSAATWQGKHCAPPPNKKATLRVLLTLLGQIQQYLSFTVREHAARLWADHGVTLHPSNVNIAIHRVLARRILARVRSSRTLHLAGLALCAAAFRVGEQG